MRRRPALAIVIVNASARDGALQSIASAADQFVGLNPTIRHRQEDRTAGDRGPESSLTRIVTFERSTDDSNDR